MMNKKDEALKMAMYELEIVGLKDGDTYNACKEALEQPTQEPVAFRNKNTGEFCTGGFLLNHGWDKEWIKLYTHPKEWQGLSDDEISELAKKHAVTSHNLGGGGFFAMEIQKKLKEKNSGY